MRRVGKRSFQAWFEGQNLLGPFGLRGRGVGFRAEAWVRACSCDPPLHTAPPAIEKGICPTAAPPKLHKNANFGSNWLLRPEHLGLSIGFWLRACATDNFQMITYHESTYEHVGNDQAHYQQPYCGLSRAPNVLNKIYVTSQTSTNRI